MAYPLAAFLTGYLAERGFDRRYLTSFLAMAAGLVVIYAFGASWLAWCARTLTGSGAVGFTAALASGIYPFILPDIVKLAAAAGVIPGVWALLGHRR